MLILTRNKGKAFLIGKNVTVRVLSIKGQRVRLGIDAPTNIKVDCEEIRERIVAEDSGEYGTAEAA